MFTFATHRRMRMLRLRRGIIPRNPNSVFRDDDLPLIPKVKNHSKFRNSEIV